ncbi:hypothetical protein P3X46_023979 [Hevea brasiliensis]|uniref:Glycosyltransferase N-terminal domain-containing protein n=1 Tax=Hevea brasiliensis TaxID=3981 RepID=A0ABQ9LEP4_HEVBR|nr:UDP-glycosyltransferase 92A1 [Hevea brasiliensis]KAJ9164401.1 hypothetical protein P3X46_023979 [Hevea brasiliensis]
MAESKQRIVMIPFMAQGHIIPFLALALQLQQRKDYMVTFVNTPLNIQELRSSLPQDSSIHLLEIPFNSSDYGLPPNTGNTDSLPYDLIATFLQSSLALKPVFRKLISDLVHESCCQPPLCIITDMFFSWCAEIAPEFGIFHAIFCGGGGYGFACFSSLWLNLPHRNTDSEEFTLPDFPEASKFHVTQLTELLRKTDGKDSISVFLRNMLVGWYNADRILMNTVEEIDKLGLMYFRKKIGRPVWPIGPALLSARTRARAGKETGIAPEVCKKWLDTKPLNSVLYISFGSQNTVSASNIMQLAMALVASGKNFIWVVRPPFGFDINSEFKAKEWLPEGYEERIKDSGRGLLVQKWAPQVEILSHRSVSAFLSHCGWNSVLEALSCGVAIMGWPQAAEQFYNVKLLEEIGVCVEVGRGKTCEVRHDVLARKIELVMNETEKGIEMRRRVCEVRDMIKKAIKAEEGCKGSSAKAMDEFLNAALLMRKESNKMGTNGEGSNSKQLCPCRDGAGEQ